jgi:hypothetical protein
MQGAPLVDYPKQRHISKLHFRRILLCKRHADVDRQATSPALPLIVISKSTLSPTATALPSFLTGPQ